MILWKEVKSLNKKNVEIKRIPSVYPFVIAGIVCVIASFILPMYKLYSYLLVIILLVGIHRVLKKMNIFKDTVIEVERPVVYESSELEEIVEQGKAQILELKRLSTMIDNSSMTKDILSIIDTSQSILDYVIENQGLVKKVRKYFHYYLEEIVKIVKQYDDFEDDPLNVEHVRVSKEKIEKTLSNANTSFIQFYNDLYEGKAMDVSVDLKVFESMLNKM